MNIVFEGRHTIVTGAGHGFDFDPESDTARDARSRAVKFLSERLRG